MKWVVFAVAVALAWPFGRLLRGRPRWIEAAMVLAGLLPFIGLDAVDINLVSIESYRGDSRGFEVTLLDLVVWALAVALPRARHPSPYRLARWIYLGAALLSVHGAAVPLYSWFAVWKLVRMYIVVAVIARAGDDPTLVAALLRGLGYGVMLQLPTALWQRYGQHAIQVSGRLSHPNTLGMSINLVAPIALALVMARRSGWRAPAVLVSAAVAVVMSLSRGSLAMSALATALVIVGSLYRAPSPRKLLVVGLTVVLAAVTVGAAWKTLAWRFVSAPRASEEARERFAEASRRMLHDHPTGVGINQFSHALESRGYGEAVGLPPGDRNGVAHHIYWLTLAEMGYLGLLGWLLIIVGPLRRAWRAARRDRSLTGDVMLGCAVGLTVMSIQGLAEWIARQTPVAYLFWIIAGLIAAVDRGAPATMARMPSPPVAGSPAAEPRAVSG